MTKREEAIEKIIRAWIVEGPAPNFHRIAQAKLRKEWPTLAGAVEDLVRTSQISMITDLKNKGAEISKQIAEIQKSCSHPNHKITYKSDTGNYDPSADSYWAVHYCGLCEKSWTTEQ